MSFGGLILTNAGRNELIRAEMGEKFSISHVVLGDGKYNGSYTEIKNLVNKIMEIPVTKISRSDEEVLIECDFNSMDVPEAFYLREIGIIANGSLCYYDNAGADAEYINPELDVLVKQKRMRFVLMISSDVEINVKIDSSLYALATDLDKVTYPEYEESADLIKLEKNEDIFSILGKVAKAISSLISHLADTVGHITATERTNWNDANSKKHQHSNKAILDTITAAFTTDEKNKLSGIETGAQKNTLTGVKGNAESSYRTGNVNITPANIGLGNVNNTADANKNVNSADYLNVTHENELRFGGNNGNTDTLWLNYTLPDGSNSAQKLTTYNFGNGQGSTEVTLVATRFKGTADAATNADTLDGYHAGNLPYLPKNMDSFKDYNNLGTGIYWGPGGTVANQPANGFRGVVLSIDLGWLGYQIAINVWNDEVYWRNYYSNKWTSWNSRCLRDGTEYLPLKGGTCTGAVNFNDTVTVKKDFQVQNGAKIYALNGTSTSAGAAYFYVDGTTAHLVSNLSNSSSYLRLCARNAIDLRTPEGTSFIGINASAFNTQSSRKYKKNIRDITEERARELLRYRVVTYDYIGETDGTDCMGLIAEEVAEIEKYPVSRNDKGEPEGLDYSKFVPQLIRMVQLQQEEIDQLKADIQKLLTTGEEGEK